MQNLFPSLPVARLRWPECEDVYASVQQLIRSWGSKVQLSTSSSGVDAADAATTGHGRSRVREAMGNGESLGKIAYRKLRAKKSIHHHKIINANKSQ